MVMWNWVVISFSIVLSASECAVFYIKSRRMGTMGTCSDILIKDKLSLYHIPKFVHSHP